MEHVDPAKREFIVEYDKRYPLDPNAPIGSPKVIRTGEPELIPDIPDEFLQAAATDPRAAADPARGRDGPLAACPCACDHGVGDTSRGVRTRAGAAYDEHDLARARRSSTCAHVTDTARRTASARDTRDDLRAILEGVADAVTAQGARRLARLRERGGRAPARLLQRRGAARRRDRGRSAPTTRCSTEDGEPLTYARCPGRRALCGESPSR